MTQLLRHRNFSLRDIYGPFSRIWYFFYTWTLILPVEETEFSRSCLRNRDRTADTACSPLRQGEPLKFLSSKSESVLRDWRTVKCKASFQPVRLFTFGNIRSSIIRATVGRIRRYRNPIYTRPLPIYTGHDNGAI